MAKKVEKVVDYKNIIRVFNDTGKPDKKLLGGKGYGLAVMTKLGLPVPKGFTITTAACKLVAEVGITEDLKAQIQTAIDNLALETKLTLGKDLLVSVRSGSVVSMPGMMDTILKVGTMQRLYDAVGEVFASWDNPRARHYRRIHKIGEDLGTACTIQQMVFGDKNDDSGTGVIFTRDPRTGERELFGEFLTKATGETLVGGIVTPRPIAELPSYIKLDLLNIGFILEDHFKDMQDIEFTYEDKVLYILQCRSGKRSNIATVKIALDLLKEKQITPEEAFLRVPPDILQALSAPSINRKTAPASIGKGLPASPGVAVGKALFSSEASTASPGGILIREQTNPDDIAGIEAASGVLTLVGGMTSHAAVVTRGMNKPAVVALVGGKLDSAACLKVGTTHIKEGDLMAIDGRTGEVFVGAVPLVEGKDIPEVVDFAALAEKIRKVA